MRGFKIDAPKERIIVTKSLLKKANEINSEAYHTLADLTQKYPNYRIEEKNLSKTNKYNGLDMSFMRKYITLHKPNIMTDFEQQVILYKKSYFKVKRWFLSNCPEYEEELEKYQTARATARKMREDKKKKEKAEEQAAELAEINNLNDLLNKGGTPISSVPQANTEDDENNPPQQSSNAEEQENEIADNQTPQANTEDDKKSKKNK